MFQQWKVSFKFTFGFPFFKNNCKIYCSYQVFFILAFFFHPPENDGKNMRFSILCFNQLKCKDILMTTDYYDY